MNLITEVEREQAFRSDGLEIQLDDFKVGNVVSPVQL